MDYGMDEMSGDEKEPSGYCVIIEVSPDGKMMVGTAKKEAIEGGGMEKEMSMMPVGSAREAMAMAMEILKNDGEMPDGQDEKEFNSGFGKKQSVMVNKEMNQEEA